MAFDLRQRAFENLRGDDVAPATGIEGIVERLEDATSPNWTDDYRIEQLIVDVLCVCASWRKQRGALKNICAVGTQQNIIRTGDAYSEDGFTEYETISEEAKIAIGALKDKP